MPIYPNDQRQTREALVDYAREIAAAEARLERFCAIVPAYYAALRPELQCRALAYLEEWLAQYEQGDRQGGEWV